MDTSELTKHGLITPEHAPRAIELLEAQADELRAAGDRFSALGLDMIANELRNRLSDGWGRPGDGPIWATFSTETLADGMVDIACRLGPSPRRGLAPRVS
jgi:hypothetical protein